MEIYQSKNVTLSYDDETGILTHTWHEYSPSKEYQECLEKSFEMMCKHHAKKWIFDQKKVKVISPQDQKWVVEVWTPKVIRKLGRGIKSAVILGENIFGEVSIKNLVDATTHQVETKFFEDIETAQKWLLEES